MILEYNQQQQVFHFNDGSTEENTNGYVTIGVFPLVDVLNVSDWTEQFIGKDIDAETIKEEWVRFCGSV